jgi:signal transduction histidine kinase
VFSTIVETVAHALKLPYAAITLRQDGTSITTASYGQPKDELTRLPLLYQQEIVGELVLAPRAPGESFTQADRALLDDLARQASMVAHAVQLSADLHRMTQELHASRTQLVTMREEERRRLRRDLHDGLGSVLTSITFQLDAAGNLLEREPQTVKAMLQDIKVQTQGSIADIRRLVYDLRPPILDDWGLISALREQMTQYQFNQLRITVDAPDSLPELPAAIELAAYRIALESIANVIRHAHASSCTLHLSIRENDLIVEVRDDGAGLPDNYRAGVGILAMRERADELGGTCKVETNPTGGTRVYACLPLLKE